LREEDRRAPVLYLTKETYTRIVEGHFDGLPLWIREIVFRPSADSYPGLMFWQYAGNGRLDGVETLVDLNVFVGNEGAFEEFVVES
jgi:lysozyme